MVVLRLQAKFDGKSWAATMKNKRLAFFGPLCMYTRTGSIKAICSVCSQCRLSELEPKKEKSCIQNHVWNQTVTNCYVNVLVLCIYLPLCDQWRPVVWISCLQVWVCVRLTVQQSVFTCHYTISGAQSCEYPVYRCESTRISWYITALRITKVISLTSQQLYIATNPIKDFTAITFSVKLGAVCAKCILLWNQPFSMNFNQFSLNREDIQTLLYTLMQILSFPVCRTCTHNNTWYYLLLLKLN